MSKEIKFRIDNPKPPKLEVLIDRVKSFVDNKEKKPVYLDILDARDAYKECGLVGENSIDIYDKKIKEKLLDNYVNMMGICFYYYESGDEGSAWFYFAKANYYIGAADYWDHALDNYTNEDLKRYERSKKGKAQVKKQDDKLLDILIEIFGGENYRHKTGWKNKTEFIDIVLKEINPVFEKLEFDKKLLPENLDRKILSLLKTCSQLIDAYEKNKIKNSQ